MNLLITFLIVMLSVSSHAEQHGTGAFNVGRYQVNADRVERTLNTVATLAPALPSLGRFVPSAGTVMELSHGRIPSRWPVARLIKEVAGGYWLAHQCGRALVSDKVDAAGQAHLFVDDFSSNPQENVKICFASEENAKNDKSPWLDTTHVKSANGMNIATAAFSIGVGKYSYITIQGKNPDRTPCFTTIRVERTANGITMSRVGKSPEDDAKSSELAEHKLYTLDQLKGILNSSGKDSNGNGIADAFDTASFRESTYQSYIENGYQKTREVAGYKCDNFSRNACRIFGANGIGCEVHWYYIGQTPHAQVYVETSNGWSYLEPQLNAPAGYLPSPTPATRIYFKYRMDGDSLVILHNPGNITPFYTY